MSRRVKDEILDYIEALPERERMAFIEEIMEHYEAPSFDVTIIEVADRNAAIKILGAFLGFDSLNAARCVDFLPTTVARGLSKEVSNRMVGALKAAGTTVEVERNYDD